MKTHDNRALFSKALLKAATCFFLIAGAGMSLYLHFREQQSL